MARVSMLLVAMVLVSCSVASAARVLQQGEDVFQEAKFKHGHHTTPKLSFPPFPKPTLPTFKLPGCPPPALPPTIPDEPITPFDTPAILTPPPVSYTPTTPDPTPVTEDPAVTPTDPTPATEDPAVTPDPRVDDQTPAVTPDEDPVTPPAGGY